MKIALFLTSVLLLASGCNNLPATGINTQTHASTPKVNFAITDRCADIEAARTAVKASDLTQEMKIAFQAALENCRLDPAPIAIETARAALQASPLAWDFTAPDTLTLYARSADIPPHLCCSIQGDDFWSPITGSDIWMAQFRLKQLDQMMLMLFVMSQDMEPLYYRGPNAPPKPDFYDFGIETLSGQVIDTELYSPELQETRRLKVYLPPNHDPSANWPLLLMADGVSLDYTARLIEPLIDRGDLAPIVIIGLLSGQKGIVEDRSDIERSSDLRAADYLPGFDTKAPKRFDQHMRFVTQTVMPWASETYGAGRGTQVRGVTGHSNGGTFALRAAYLHPEHFDVSMPMSPGFGTITEAVPAPADAPAYWVSGGTLEPYFLRSAQKSAETLSAAGYSVTFTPYYAGHASDQWDQALADVLPKAFPPKP